jgi:hypothetical protein
MEISQDIIDSVIEAVGDDTQLLKQCSLVSSSFLRPSRKQLFSRITISDQTYKGIHQVLIKNPVIQSFVKSITLEYNWAAIIPRWMDNNTSLVAILRLPFSCLESFSITVRRDYWNRLPWTWYSINNKLKDALFNIIHSPNLKTLSLNGIPRVPITFFSHIVQLTTLEVHSLSPYDFTSGGVVEGVERSRAGCWLKKCGRIAVRSVLNLPGHVTRRSRPTVPLAVDSEPLASHPVIDRCVWYYWDEYLLGNENSPFIDLFFFSLMEKRFPSVDIPTIHKPSTLP